jgi:bla regulator protein blaR1
MKRNILLFISSVTIVSGLFFLSSQDIITAQVKSDDEGIYMVGTIDKGIILTGYFNRNRSNLKNQDWCVFVGENGQVYKLLLTDKKVLNLHIDGQKIEDNQIEKHSAEFSPFLTRYLRSREIENETRELEFKMKPFERKIQALDQEISKLDKAEEKLEKAMEKNSASFAEDRKSIRAQQKRISEMQRGHEKELEMLSDQQEKLSNEQESLGLDQEIDKLLLRISEDLKSVGLIKTTTNLSFKLSNLELVVNGKKISAETYQKLKVKYVFDFSDESGFLYHWKWKD